MHEDQPLPDEVLELARMVAEAPVPTEIHHIDPDAFEQFDRTLELAMMFVCVRLTHRHIGQMIAAERSSVRRVH